MVLLEVIPYNSVYVMPTHLGINSIIGDSHTSTGMLLFLLISEKSFHSNQWLATECESFFPQP